MKVDFHVQTSFSGGKNTPAEMAAVAKKKGLGAMAITDLGIMDGWKNFSPKNFIIIPGVKLNTDQGPVLVYGADKLPDTRELVGVKKWAKSCGYLIVPAHFNDKSSLGELALEFEVVEAINGRSPPWVCKDAVNKALSAGVRYLSNSGARSAGELGEFYNTVEEDAEDWEDIVKQVKKGKFEPRLRFPGVGGFLRSKLF